MQTAGVTGEAGEAERNQRWRGASDPDGAQSAGTFEGCFGFSRGGIEVKKMLKPRKTKVSQAIQEL